MSRHRAPARFQSWEEGPLRHVDRYGLPLTTDSGTAVEWYVDGLDRILALNAGSEEAFGAAIFADAGFALAHADLGFLLWFSGRTEEARGAVRAARRRVGHCSRRELQHVEALALVIDGEGPAALGFVIRHLDEFPRDALILYVGMFLISFGGGPRPKEATLDLYQQVAPAYGDDWWFLGSLSFALHELDRFAEAWPLAERSLAKYPRNASAVHSLAHLHYEGDDHPAGLGFLADWLASYERQAPYHAHLHWHQALHQLALGDVEGVMRTYWDALSPAVASGSTVLTDASSLLWRMELWTGIAGLPWAELSGLAREVCSHPGFAFADLHAAMTCVGGGDQAGLVALTDGLRALDRRGHPLAGSVVLPLVEGLDSFAAGNFGATIARLEPVLDAVVRVGGTHLQREVFEDTLLLAYLRSGAIEAGEDLLKRRLQRRPSGQDQRLLAGTQTGPAV